MDVTYCVIAIMAVVYGDDSELHVILHVIERLQASDILPWKAPMKTKLEVDGI